MRPQQLFPLYAPPTALPGVGPRVAALLEKLAGPHVVDLCWHLPTGLIDRRNRPTIADAVTGAVATLTVTVERHFPGAGRRQPYRVRCADATGFLHLVFFHARRDYLEKLLPVGAERVVSGRVERFNAEVQIVHPEHVAPPEEADAIQPVEPVYPLTAGIAPKLLRRAIRAALDRAPDLAEWQDPAFVAREGWPSWKEALETAHAPAEEADLVPQAPHRARLAYDELLANQLALALVRQRQRRLAGRPVRASGALRRRMEAALPFALTAAQVGAGEEIRRDLASGDRMLRLLQGDVGSGKTVVALAAMLDAVEAGAQAALMAPTEILARQHFATLARLAEPAGIDIALLTGREMGAARAALLQRIADGSAPIVVGTHALFQDEVRFRDLALAVVDEQHRFGVEQRVALAAKGMRTHVLVMTATPIPRTLTLTAYGDMDVSLLREKPAGRQPVDTRVAPAARLDMVKEAVARALARGTKVYWVCPLVQESEQSDLAAAEARHQELYAAFGPRVGLVHGRMKGAEKDAVMAAFATGPVDLLVATTVIEVGVDVPAATVMVIEHAERFGLAQLHQLRGRIGRGGGPSTCILIYTPPLGETARARLQVMRETEDGFRIAEEDLRLRGAGEILGTRQSGMPAFRLADLAQHADLLATARDDVALILARDPDLVSPRGEALRTLLYLFERDAAVRYARAG
ncbi:MAG: ATP-dependent DNA helicase RecG [Alphaproteobacteria bacterium]